MEEPAVRICLLAMVAAFAFAETKPPEITDAQRVEMLKVEAAYWNTVAQIAKLEAQKDKLEALRSARVKELQKVCEAGGSVFAPDTLSCKTPIK